jgi:hypothetical protein
MMKSRYASTFAMCFLLGAMGLAPSAQATPFSPATLDSLITACVAEIDADSLFSYMNQMGAFTTRHSASDTTSTTTGIGAARRWVFDKFLEFASQGGNITAFYHDFTTVISGVNRLHRNVVGEIPGTVAGEGERIYVLSGHLDSRNENVNDAVGLARGVDDDASGVACALELARVMSQRSWPMTLRLVAFTGEEQGLIGSEFLANVYDINGEPIAAMFSNDIMAGINGAPDPDSTVTTDSTKARAFATPPEESPHRQLHRYLKAMANAYVPIQDIVLVPAEDRPGRGSDHQSFIAHGFTAIRYMEYNERLDLQHTQYDTMGVHLDKNYLRRNAQVDLATFANLMLSPAPPTGLTVGDVGDSTGFRLTWPTTNTEPDLDGYRITLRSPGTLDYEQVIDVGLVNELVVSSPPNDSLYFGLSAVDDGGHPSLISEEVLGVLSSEPQPPSDLTAIPTATEVSLAWNPSAEGDLLGYRVYRSDTSNGPYTLIASPSSASYDDGTAVPGTMHFYVVTAVDSDSNESGFSNEASGRLITLDSGILLVDETRSGTTAWFPSDALADSVYAQMLVTLPHDSWDVDSLGIPTLSDIGIYSSVLWVQDDFNTVFQGFLTITQRLRDATSVLSEYMDAGGNVMLTSWDGVKGIHPLDAYPFNPAPGDFFYDYFGIDAIASKEERAFNAGIGQGFFPSVTLEPARLRPQWAGELIRVEYLTGIRPGTQTAYLFGSGEPDSAYHNQPCGLYRDAGTYRTVYLGFPLYHLKTVDARAALEMAMGFFGEISTDASTSGPAPLTLALGQSRPNPSRGRTEITYAVPHPGHAVELVIYDVLGRRVRTLVSGKVEPGLHREIWDGHNDSGNEVASSVYFYRLKAEGRELTKKLVLLR